MKIAQTLVVLAVVLALVWLPGCKEAGPSQGDASQIAEKIAQANDILIPKIILLAGSGTTDPAQFDFSSAASLYNEVLSMDPNNKDAHFGLAIIDVLSIFGDPALAGLSKQTGVPLSPSLVGSFSDFQSMIRTTASLGTDLAGRFTRMFQQRMAMALGKTSLVATHLLPSYYQDLVESAVLPKLTSAIAHLNIVLTGENYVFLITPDMTGGNTTETFRIDATEIYLFRGFLQFVTADASAFVAYTIDYVPQDSAFVRQAWQPASSFLAFRTNGSQRMKDTHANFLGAASSVRSALVFLMNEPPNPETDLINYNPADAPLFADVINGLDSLQQILSAPYDLPNGVTIDLEAFFNNAIPNYKLKLPAYTVSIQPGIQEGTYDAVLTWTAATFDDWTFPDPTMNGLFPGMTNDELKAVLGITVDTWEPTVVIPGS